MKLNPHLIQKSCVCVCVCVRSPLTDPFHVLVQFDIMVVFPCVQSVLRATLSLAAITIICRLPLLECYVPVHDVITWAEVLTLNHITYVSPCLSDRSHHPRETCVALLCWDSKTRCGSLMGISLHYIYVCVYFFWLQWRVAMARWMQYEACDVRL